VEPKHANPLGQELLVASRFDQGTIFAVIPRGATRDAYAFKSSIRAREHVQRHAVSGGFLERVPSTEVDVAEWLAGALSQQNRLLISESYLPRASV